MTYTAAQARQELLDALAEATDEIALALAALGGAYELLDERTGEALEERLFRPVQLAYGRAKRTHSVFAERHGLPARTFTSAASGLPSRGVAGFVEQAGEAAANADELLAALQDSLMPVEVGDAELRAGLADVRGLLGGLPASAAAFMRTFGR